jgi:hypothetical protein
MHQPGIEPGPLRWKRSILTTGLLVLYTGMTFLVRGETMLVRATGIEPVTN